MSLHRFSLKVRIKRLTLEYMILITRVHRSLSYSLWKSYEVVVKIKTWAICQHERTDLLNKDTLTRWFCIGCIHTYHLLVHIVSIVLPEPYTLNQQEAGLFFLGIFPLAALHGCIDEYCRRLLRSAKMWFEVLRSLA